MNTFESHFGDGGNTAELDLDWQCGGCGAFLDFILEVETVIDVEWTARCCGTKYTISPCVATYHFQKEDSE